MITFMAVEYVSTKEVDTAVRSVNMKVYSSCVSCGLCKAHLMSQVMSINPSNISRTLTLCLIYFEIADVD
jgi:hypothetical protein